MTNKVKLIPPVNTRYPLSLIKFANSVLNLTVTAQSLKMESYINNPQLLSQLVQKLPEHLQFQWARIIVDKEKAIPIPTLKEFSEWLQKKTSAASLLCKPSTSSFTSSDRYSERKPKNTVLVGSEEALDRRNCIFCSESGHSLYHCQKCLSLEVDGRRDWVKERKICFSCLSPSHSMFGCENKRRCRVQNCSKYHNRLLHSELSSKNYSQHSSQVQNGSSNVNVEKRKGEPDNSACCIDEHSFQLRSVTKTVLLRIIPVKIIGIKKSVETFALFDEGSTVTLIDANLPEDIGVQGFNDPLKMYWTNSSSYVDNHSRKNWFNGPKFLSLDIEFWPQEKDKIEENTTVEKKTNILLVIKDNKDDRLFDFTRFSNYLRLIRTAAWIIRFVFVLKNKIGLSM
ncbi:hypothetical protein JTB14_030040 [Gonioctena quinquepunctata]|nr:hypothetical protein JTB14_030040 [Gonioctena quinquepunctata]